MRKLVKLLSSIEVPNNFEPRKFVNVRDCFRRALAYKPDCSLTFASVTDNMSYLEDGWVLWSRGRGGTTEGVMVYAQLWAEKEGGRGEIFQLAVCGRNLTTDKLRSIPLGAHPNTREHRS